MNRPCGWAKKTRSALRPPGGRTGRYRMAILTTSLTTTTPKAQAAGAKGPNFRVCENTPLTGSGE